MKTLLLCAGGLLLSGCAALTPATVQEVSDRIGVVKADLDRSLETIREDREERGVPAGKGLGLQEWLLIGSSLLGANYLRDRKYVKKAVNGG